MTTIEIEKIRQIAIYLADKIDDLYFTKFLKLVYYLDFISVQETGAPVTNDSYFALPYGPVPSYIKEGVDLLDQETRKQEVALLIDPSFGESEYGNLKSIFDGFIKLEKNGGTILKPAKPFEENVLSEYEKKLLDDIINEFKDVSVKDIVDKTHKESPYIQTPLNGRIDYRMAFQLDIKTILPKRNFSYDKEISFVKFLS